jgi:hypothetical protein
MAGRILNRRELRKQADQAEQVEQVEQVEAEAEESADGEEEEVAVKPKKKPRAKAPAVKKPRKKKEAPRMCARWGVFDASMKQVAIFDYKHRAAADEKVAELIAKKKAVHFLQIVKEPIVEPPEPAAV